ncbi:MAG: hypothetical protein C0397_14895, partial [Odoribacter sp.]|nr:hypothetical protein [Odoribacter sp.]
TLSSNTAQKPTFTAPEVAANTNYTFSLVVNDGSLSSTADQVVITVKQVNKAPIANAGSDQSPNEGTLVALDGSASSDPDGSTPLTYLWTPPAGITLSSNTAQKPTFTAPEVAANTNYTFSLVVNDGSLSSTADQVVITVKQVNKAPVANAGPDQTVAQNHLVSLNGSLSTDLDNDLLTYLWTAPAGIVLSNSNMANPEFQSPNVTIDTDYSFTLKVNDGALDSPEDKVVVRVLTYRVPIANAGSDFSSNEGLIVSLDGSASSDPKGGALTYQWTAPSGIILSSNTAQKTSFTAPQVAQDSPYTFSLIVNNGVSNSLADQITITIKHVNKPPVANAGNDSSPYESTLVTLNGSESFDEDNDEISYLWTPPAGINLNSNSVMKPIFFTPSVDSETYYTFKLTVHDGNLTSLPDYVVITVRNTNKKPVANAGTDKLVDEGTITTLDGTSSSDPENDALTYLWTAPNGITLNSPSASNPTFTAPEVQTDQTYTFTLTVNDGKLDSFTDEVIITVKQINKAPIANAGRDQTVIEYSIYALDGSESFDQENDGLVYFWTAPTGINLNSNSAMKPVFFTPSVNSATEYTFKLTVNDGFHTSLPDFVVITVKKVNEKPVANAGINKSVNEGAIASLDGTGSSDPENEAITYLWSAPNGITLSSSNASKPTFTAPEVQSDITYTFTLTVNDGKLDSYTDEVEVTIKQVNKAPFADAGTDQTVNEKSVCTLDGSTSMDSDSDALTYLWTSPAGVTLSSNTAQKPTFTAPEVSVNTSYTFTLVVNDGKLNSSTDQVVITVKQVNKAPVYNSFKTFKANEGEPVEFTLGGSDMDNDPIVFSIENLPSFLKLTKKTANTAVLSGTFSKQYVGNNPFKLTLSDGALSTNETIIIEVSFLDVAPYVKDSIKNMSVEKMSSDKVIDLRTVFADDNPGDELTFRVSSNTNKDIVIPKIIGSYLILSFSTEKIGISEIVVTASSNGKEVNSKFTVEVNIPTGIVPGINDPDVSIYPNPAKEKVFLKFSQLPKTGTCVTVYTHTGIMMSRHLADGQEEFIDMKNLPSGLYLIKIDQSVSKTYKVVLE